jgi:hypothetical protein
MNGEDAMSYWLVLTALLLMAIASLAKVMAI